MGSLAEGSKDDNCEACKAGLNYVIQRQDEMMVKHWWYVHLVVGNVHTHGLQESFGHPDIQVVLPIAPETIHSVIAGIVERIKGGEKFFPSRRYDKVIMDYDVVFGKAREGGREVLRLILPDPVGCLSKKAMRLYVEQWEGVEVGDDDVV